MNYKFDFSVIWENINVLLAGAWLTLKISFRVSLYLSMAQYCAREMNLKLFPPPIAIEGFNVATIWHQRNNSPRNLWLQEQIVNAVRDI